MDLREGHGQTTGIPEMSDIICELALDNEVFAVSLQLPGTPEMHVDVERSATAWLLYQGCKQASI